MTHLLQLKSVAALGITLTLLAATRPAFECQTSSDQQEPAAAAVEQPPLPADGELTDQAIPRSPDAPAAAHATGLAARVAASDLSAAFRAAADRALPSVVAVETGRHDTTKMTRGDDGGKRFGNPYHRKQPLGELPFEDLFRNFPREKGLPPGMPRGAPHRGRTGIGSGVIIDAAGLILTNHHVIADAASVSVRLHDGREFPVAEVWSDPDTDIAVLKIEGATSLVPAALGDSDRLAVGDWVLALGQPFGLESTVTAGIISGSHRTLGITARDDFLQTDAAINPGNSGGPLVNLAGEVVGINTAISSRDGGNDGIGFAVPANMARWVADQLVEHGEVRRAHIGIGIQLLTPALAKRLQVERREGIVVTQVRSDSPAAAAGLKPGDVVVRYAGVDITRPGQLQILVERTPTGKTRTMEVFRDGQPVQLSVTPAELPGDTKDAGPTRLRKTSPSGTKLDQLGLTVEPPDESRLKQSKRAEGAGIVIAHVAPDSPAAKAGLEPGMVILAINRRVVETVSEAVAAVEAAASDEPVLLLVNSGIGTRFVVIIR